MSRNQQSPTQYRETSTQQFHRQTHDLVRITEWLPGDAPSDTTVELSEDGMYRARYWRCRACGQERNQRDHFRTACDGDRTSPLKDGGYSIDEPRTRRALTENMGVHFVERGPRYRVNSESGNVYDVNIQESTCSCPDYRKRKLLCKHLRRVDLEIRTGIVPAPDGTFTR